MDKSPTYRLTGFILIIVAMLYVSNDDWNNDPVNLQQAKIQNQINQITRN